MLAIASIVVSMVDYGVGYTGVFPSTYAYMGLLMAYMSIFKDAIKKLK